MTFSSDVPDRIEQTADGSKAQGYFACCEDCGTAIVLDTPNVDAMRAAIALHRMEGCDG